MAPSHGRRFDLVLVGATGFVGRLTAQHLARYAPRDLRVALAGRSRERLTALQSELGGTAGSWPLLVVDVTDEAAAADLAASTRVVVTTVGPYLRYGMALVSACADAGTAYADLTGETLFVRRTVDALHERAVASGARIVHACGFDSVPSDLGVGLTAIRAEADSAGTLTDTVLHVRSARGGISGGTIDSLRQQLVETSGDSQARALVGRADALVDRPSGTRTRAPGRVRPVERDSSGGWQAPFVMGVFNRQIVLRSDALAGRRYGIGFRYREVVDTGSGPRGVLGATALSLGTVAFVAAMGFGPARALLDRVLPDPGSGPSETALARGRFRVEVVAGTSSGARYQTVVGADLDPGYYGTAVMLGESGLSLALDDLPTRGGVLTPMTAMGDALAARLRAHEFTVSTDRI
ncbi:saccharopine dehydrogenase family protein [uncultured Friedmanniella sp.]|uniref:saccharopine dehydrogenase family protein n=1 Tax=uncultured Friedmanniella sp. TaxID=335381 RepID=UPI0035CBF3C6